MTDLPQSSQDKIPEYSIENDPLFQPISDEKAKIIDESIKKKMKTLSLDQIVDTDTTKINGQNYALISIVSPQSTQQYDKLCLKIKGVFSQLDEAQKYAKQLQQIDSTFDIYVVEMYSWLLIPPDPTLIEQVHVDNKLNEIISGHRENQLKAKAHFDERKRDLIDNIEKDNEEKEKDNAKIRERENTRLQTITETSTETITETSTETITETSTETITETSTEKDNPEGIISESSINITNQESSDMTPTELMHQMVIDKIKENPSKSWADEMEEVN